MTLQNQKIKKRSFYLGVLFLLAVFSCAQIVAATPRNEPYVSELTIYVPGAVGGGFDHTAVAIKKSLLKENLVKSVTLVRSPGAGGLVALAQFIESDDPNSVMIGGGSIIGASRYNRSVISLDDVEPLVRLNGTAIAMAVQPDSPIRGLNDLLLMLQTDPELVQWVGGSAGSVDQMYIFSLMNELGMGAHRINYNAIPGGGGNIVDQLISKNFTVAVSSYEELAPFVKNDELRIISLSYDDPNNSQDVLSSLREHGVNTSFVDWRGVFASPKIDRSDTLILISIFEDMAKSETWMNEVKQNNWINLFLPQIAFEKFVGTEIVRNDEDYSKTTVRVFKNDVVADFLTRQTHWKMAIMSLISALCLFVLAQRFILRRDKKEFISTLREAEMESDELNLKLRKAAAESANYIDAQFDSWGLSSAEKEIGWLLLKGLSFKEIAKLRGTNQRTVRQQAGSIYSKSNLGNRSNLAAFFLEDICFSYNDTLIVQ